MARKRKLDQQPIPNGTTEHSSDHATLEAPGSRRKKTTVSRIGRACDRCQHRKLACDPSPEGCPPCLRVGAWCTVTDPLTGNPTYRGEFEYLERKVAQQKAQIEELLGKLRGLGEDVKPYKDDDPGTKQYLNWTKLKATGDTRPWDRDERQLNLSRLLGPQQGQNDDGSPNYIGGHSVTESCLPLHSSSSDALGLPDLRSGLSGDSYVGASPNSHSQGSDRTPKLNMLAWEINIASFTAGGLGRTRGLSSRTYDTSYESFIATTFGVNPRLEKVELPSRQVAFRYAEGYFLIINAFLPILHKPSFMSLLTKMYDDKDFQPTPAEKVMAYSLFANILYQDALRNWEDPKRQEELHKQSDKLYHCSLGVFPQLMVGHTLQDVQALAMICTHVRNFPKPESSWVVTNITFTKAIEQRLHRSMKPSAHSASSMTILDVELRKRTFWSILAIQVTLSGKLGRPLPVREEDYDVELPLQLDDELLSADGLDTSRKGNCSFLVAIEFFKLMPITMDLFRNSYTANKSPKEYTTFVSAVEKRVKAWEDQWPKEVFDDHPRPQIFSRYLRLWLYEVRLILHHPSLSMTRNVQFNDSNLRTCLELSHNMLLQASELQQIKGLDSTWYNCATYIMAIQTTLYGHGQLKDEMTQERLAALKSNMEQWLSIMGDIGGLLGSGRRLQDAIRGQIDTAISQLEQHLAAKCSSPPPGKMEKSSPGNVESDGHPTALARRNNFNATNEYEFYENPDQRMNGYVRANEYLPVAVNDQNLNPYNQMDHYPYPETSGTNFGTNSGMTAPYGSSPYHVGLANQALSSSYQSQSHPGVSVSVVEMYAPPIPGYNSVNNYSTDTASWFPYSQTIPPNVGPQDYNPASALLQLGGRTDQSIGMNPAEVPEGFDTSGMSGGAGQMWPMGVLDQGRSGP